jgi:hypothetical protein
VQNVGIQCSALYDNVCPHTVARTQTLLECLNWELFDQLPHSPDLAPSDYCLFTFLKKLPDVVLLFNLTPLPRLSTQMHF